MLARTSKIIHKTSGTAIETPLLVPSFSSKGFARNKEGKSEIGTAIQYASEFLTKTFLISAYDIYYGHISPPKEIPVIPELIFVDSGGYEISWNYDYSAVVQTPPYKEPWRKELHENVLNQWPREIPAVFVNYDHPDHKKPIQDQVREARELFRSHQNHLHLFLLKPETKRQSTLTNVMTKVLVKIEELSPFDIIGVTEKELGNSMLDRMTNIAKLRNTLDKAGLDVKIHVFGALDPLTVCLYFLSGAEIFDGLTWIRYAYDLGRCVYLHNHGALKYGLHSKDNQVKLRAMTDNIYSLETLEHKMREFVATGDFAKFSPHEDFMKQARDSLSTQIKGDV